MSLNIVCVVTSLVMALFIARTDVSLLLDSSIAIANMQAAAQGHYCPDATTVLPWPEGKFYKCWTLPSESIALIRCTPLLHIKTH